MGGEQRRYMSYSLRLWQAGSGSERVWRASLQSPHTGERTGFPSLEGLFAFLRLQTEWSLCSPHFPPHALLTDAEIVEQ